MGFKRVAVIGLGYVGLPTAVVFAYKGYKVIGLDIDEKKVNAIKNRRSYIREPKLDIMLKQLVESRALDATTDPEEALVEADAVIIAVPTPVKKNGSVYEPHLNYLENALRTVRDYLKKGMLISIESTIPPGTTDGLARSVLESSGLRVEEDFYLVHVPERLAPGRAIEELLAIPRIVGGVGPRSLEKGIELYRKVNPNLIPTSAIVAEVSKLVENTYRDLNIAYANMLALIAERLGIDVMEVIEAANTHPRVSILRPGAGVGGPCLTKDPYMLFHAARGAAGSELILLARRINDYMPMHMVELIERALEDAGKTVDGARIAILGVAYKGGVDDTRESPAKIIITELLRRGAEVVVYDPYTSETFGARRAGTLEAAARNADALVIVTDHPEFRKLPLNNIKSIMATPVLIDGRRIVDPAEATRVGFRYYGVGYGVGIKSSSNGGDAARDN